MRFSIQGRLLRQSIRNGIVLAGNIPKADLDLLKSLFGAQRFVHLQEQVEVGGLGVPIGTKMVVLHPQNSGTCHDKCARVEGKIEKGGATYLPSRKPFSHTLDDVLGVRGDDP